MKKNILRLFVVLLAVMFLSTPVMAKSKKSDKKPWYSYLAMKAKIISLERKLRSKIKEIKYLNKKVAKVSSQKRGPRGPKGEPGPQGLAGPMGPEGPQGEPGVSSDLRTAGFAGDTPPLVCGGCEFSEGTLPIEIQYRLPGAYLVHAYMAGIDLNGVDLTGADLRGAQITYGDLSGATLIDADLSAMPFLLDYDGTGHHMEYRTTLKGTDMTDAKLDGVIWGNTICPDGTNSDEDDGDGKTCLDNLVP